MSSTWVLYLEKINPITMDNNPTIIICMVLKKMYHKWIALVLPRNWIIFDCPFLPIKCGWWKRCIYWIRPDLSISQLCERKFYWQAEKIMSLGSLLSCFVDILYTEFLSNNLCKYQTICCVFYERLMISSFAHSRSSFVIIKSIFFNTFKM